MNFIKVNVKNSTVKIKDVYDSFMKVNKDSFY